MGKGNIKFGYKSGILPEVRNIFKTPIKPVVRPANSNVGYAEGVEHPKGSSREQPTPSVRTIESLIGDTVKSPKNIPNLKKLNEAQKAKVTKAALRREYYQESLVKEAKRIDHEEIRAKKIVEAEAKRKLEEVFEISEATKLTLPTISNLLEGPFMRQRTEEEQEILNAKREANRLNNVLTGELNRASNVLELFYASENFITTEDQLKAAVESAFSSTYKRIDFDPEVSLRSHKLPLQDSLFGTINRRPGLVQVEEQLSGESSQFKDSITDAYNKKLEEERSQSI